MSSKYGKLYVVATPIGNLGDLSIRAIEVLKQVDLIAAEDTRHVRMLLQHYGISNRVESLHQHNELKASIALKDKMLDGLSVALVSDAGTPLLSDPGMPLVKMAKDAGLDVSPVPGACALIAALSVSGLPVSRFCYEGFLPRTSSARKAFFKQKLNCEYTWVCYESSHRILSSLRDMAEILPDHRQIVIARELTKLYETVIKGRLDDILLNIEQDENMRKGEFVVIVEGVENVRSDQKVTPEQEKILSILMSQCSVKTAVDMAVEITGSRKKLLYQAALKMTKKVEGAED